MKYKIQGSEDMEAAYLQIRLKETRVIERIVKL